MSARKKKGPDALGESLFLRLSAEDIARLKRLEEALAVQAAEGKSTLSQAARVAMRRGLDIIEAEAKRTRGGE